ncbi:MAG: Ldh family oxidoreductase [Anaerolineaceae bacterium]|nr:Ldh family oxidoreductase [Anaerolineaceae bacterium]
MENEIRPVPHKVLRSLVSQVMQKLGETEENAHIIADVLVTADLRGVDSHGVARLSFYVGNIKAGVIRTNVAAQVVNETPTTALLDAGGGMGQPVSYKAMQMAIAKAEQYGLGFVTVRNSNHYGIAGYYAMMALEHGCVGMSMTNSRIFVVPTFGSDAMLGTNPIAVAAPAGNERPFVLDMATSTVPYGKVEVYDRLEKPMPLGWASDENGIPTTDAAHVIENMESRPARGGLEPLGGNGELLSGHKGYGLGLLVEVLCGVLPGALFADQVYPKAEDGTDLPAGLGHVFGALRVDAFRPLKEFAASMDDLQSRMKNAHKAAGQERIYVHGEKEYEQADRRSRLGIPLNPKVLKELEKIAEEYEIDFKIK